MEEKFKKIPPEEVFVTTFDRPPTEEELWQGLPSDFNGNRPSGNNLIDLYARVIRKYGRKDIYVYARIMGLTSAELSGAVRAIGGMGATEWRNRYLLLEAKELLRATDWEIGKISGRLGFTQPSVFSKWFRSYTKEQPWEWRMRRVKPGWRGRKTYHWNE